MQRPVVVFVLKFFMKNSKSEFSTNDLSYSLGLELSTVQRSVKKLHEKNILIKGQKNLNNGGYLFHYKLRSKKEIKAMIISIINDWTKKVEHELQDWE